MVWTTHKCWKNGSRQATNSFSNGKSPEDFSLIFKAQHKNQWNPRVFPALLYEDATFFMMRRFSLYLFLFFLHQSCTPIFEESINIMMYIPPDACISNACVLETHSASGFKTARWGWLMVGITNPFYSRPIHKNTWDSSWLCNPCRTGSSRTHMTLWNSCRTRRKGRRAFSLKCAVE